MKNINNLELYRSLKVRSYQFYAIEIIKHVCFPKYQCQVNIKECRNVNFG